ncbi:MAG: transmembrane anchor protein [Brevundimonas sp.]|jgi:hypothetical protein|uniref:Plastocyanin n=1 Tax=Brevundimonas aurantiaca TaxID=74316 RepID=A0A7W9C4Q7_9CAUL|nr:MULTISPECIES: hypothetical protein [Brevundimonas]MBU1538883.1 transmembrane anchor protein [Alphaproteobacteria bacterium]OGN51943.1 MAG: transmembrane anchor protein [Caulobacterales bacterium RIFOXYB1_FULL_67_16]OYX36609.1 MAG: transmembrane anchor protein [Caulobacterales bacterium 32-69-10]ALJ09452.1 transmembrane anchor protein [Brevundimonas sp. DS20]MBB5738557.1 plastocyanin [Brevundimonas aurantiaca]
MFNANRPARSELPTTQELLKSTGIAAVVAGAILVTVVLPAEYGVDPTRIGSVFGLTEMGQLKRQLALEAEADAAADAAAAGQTSGVASTPTPAAAPAAATGPVAPSARPVTAEAAAAGIRSDETVIELAPNQGAELKMDMAEGAKVRFTWRSSGGAVNFDTHADRPGVRYHGYGKGTDLQQSGELTAAFDGSHGWFWRNRTGETVTITVETEGAYTEIKRVV